MRLTLERLRMENFKGIRQLSLDFSESRTDIRGMNGTGKTTIVDAFCWVLFNQNAAGDAPGSDSFREKPLDESGQVIHHLDTTVELYCLLDGHRFDLKRTQVENWVKKRGNSEAVFQGNASTYWINGVETKQADFRQRIKAIADDEVFRLVGSLSAFNQLEWKKRRAQLLALVDNDIDGVLLATDEYRPVADEVAQRNVSVDDLRKVLADQAKAIKSELKMLPVRIDEAKKSMPQFKPTEIRDAEYLLDDTKKTLETVENRIAELKAQGGAASNQGQILALEQEIVSYKRRMMDEREAERRALQRSVDETNDDFRRLTARLADVKFQLKRTQDDLEKSTAYTDGLRDEFLKIKRQAIVVADHCPTCDQALPAAKIEDARITLEAARKAQLSEIKAKGKNAAIECESLQTRKESLEAEAADVEARVKAAQTAREAAMAALHEFHVEPDFAGDTALQGLLQRLEALKADHAQSPDEKLREFTDRKRELLELADKQLKVLAKRDIAIESEERIKSYERRLQELGAQLSEVEVLTGLVEQFITARCGALESSINGHFPTVRWKLFDTQINGGIVDVCTCMVECDGAMVPYTSANTASQINADIEIVNVLSDKYDVRVPLFVDNSERVIRLALTDTQLITLGVSTDNELTVMGA